MMGLVQKFSITIFSIVMLATALNSFLNYINYENTYSAHVQMRYAVIAGD